MSDYATLAEVKEVGSDVITTTDYDTLLSNLITRASRLIDAFMRQEDSWFVALVTATDRYYDGSDEEILFIDECMEITAITYQEDETTWTAWASSDYQELGPDLTKNTSPICALQVDPYGDYDKFEKGTQNFKVTAKWGYSTSVPDVVKQACIAQTLYMFKRGQQAFQDQGGVTELGTVAFVRGLCKDAVDLLDQMPKRIG